MPLGIRVGDPPKGYLAKRVVARKYFFLHTWRSRTNPREEVPHDPSSTPTSHCVPVATQPQLSSSFPVTEQEKTKPCEKDSRMGKEPRRGMGKPLVTFRWWLGKTLTTLWVASWLFLLFSLCWLQAVSPGLAAPWGQMLPAFQGNGELESRQERLRKSGVSAGNAPGQERRGKYRGEGLKKTCKSVGFLGGQGGKKCLVVGGFGAATVTLTHLLL